MLMLYSAVFQEWRHAHGMRCLGIPNTAHFANVTLIEDAIACKFDHNKARGTQTPKGFCIISFKIAHDRIVDIFLQVYDKLDAMDICHVVINEKQMFL